MKQLQRFINDYLHRNSMSIRALAEKMDMQDTTIGRFIKAKNPAPPKLQFLINLAKATNTDIREIIVMVAPDEVIKGVNSDAASLASRLSKLSNDDLKIIDRFLTGPDADLAKKDDEA